MSTLDVVQDWMTRIGPMLDLARVTAYPGERRWALVTDDDLLVDCVLDEAVGRLVLEADAAALPPQRRTASMEALLRWNAAWTQHGGLRAALPASDGPVSVLLDVPLATLDLPGLTGVLARYIDTVRAWRDSLASDAAAPQLPGSGAPPMMRV